jgi:hypothetical protein
LDLVWEPNAAFSVFGGRLVSEDPCDEVTHVWSDGNGKRSENKTEGGRSSMRSTLHRVAVDFLFLRLRQVPSLLYCPVFLPFQVLCDESPNVVWLSVVRHRSGATNEKLFMIAITS